MSFSARTPCTICSGKAQPGAVDLMKYLLLFFVYAASLGIYNCRNVAGSTTKSQHACGRALDVKIPTLSDGKANTSLGNPVVLWLIKWSTQLGVTEIIYNRVIYDAKSPKGRYYGGVHPHYDHVHFALIHAKAISITFAFLVSMAGWPNRLGDPMLGFTIGKLGDPSVGGPAGDPVGDQAQALQLALIKRGESLPQFGADRFAGDETRTALRSFQSKNSISTTHPEYTTGTIGPHTHASLYAVAGSGGPVATVDAKIKAHADNPDAHHE